MRYISKDIVRERLQFIADQCRFITESTSRIQSPDEFMTSMNGVVLFNSTCMCLQTIGETVRQLDDHTNGTLMALYPTIPWGSVKGMRNFISHEYLSIDHSVIYATVKKNVPSLQKVIETILQDFCEGKLDSIFSTPSWCMLSHYTIRRKFASASRKSF